MNEKEIVILQAINQIRRIKNDPRYKWSQHSVAAFDEAIDALERRQVQLFGIADGGGHMKSVVRRYRWNPETQVLEEIVKESRLDFRRAFDFGITDRSVKEFAMFVATRLTDRMGLSTFGEWAAREFAAIPEFEHCGRCDGTGWIDAENDPPYQLSGRKGDVLIAKDMVK